MVYCFVLPCHQVICLHFNITYRKGFPKSKIIIHSDVHLLEQLHLSHIHFREMDEDAFSYKSTHPEIEVSMSTHSIESVKAAYEHDLDYVFLVTFLRHLQNLINCLDQKQRFNVC